jgi:hypothetical protein
MMRQEWFEMKCQSAIGVIGAFYGSRRDEFDKVFRENAGGIYRTDVLRRICLMTGVLLARWREMSIGLPI